MQNEESFINKKYKIITLCGSIRFKDEFMKVQEKLTLDGNIVLTPNFFNNIKKEDILEKVQKMKLNMQKQEEKRFFLWKIKNIIGIYLERKNKNENAK